MKKLLLTLACVSLVACGSESSSSSTEGAANSNTANNPVDINMAAKSNGASVTSTYDSSAAEYVIDGDTTTSLYWSGNITDDSLTVDMGKAVSASSITVYTNDTSFSTNNPFKTVDVSADGSTWLRTLAPFGNGDIACPTYVTGSGRVYCNFESDQSFRYVKVTITAQSNPGLVQIHEVEVMGH